MENDGSRPAHGVRITFEAQGDVFLVRPPFDDEDTTDKAHGEAEARTLPRLPAPPKPPEWRRVVVERAKRLPIDNGAAILLDALGRAEDLAMPKSMRAFMDLDALVRGEIYSPPLPEFRIPEPYVPPRHDPEGFYYDKPLSPGIPIKSQALTCDRLRHKARPERFEFNIQFPDEKARSASVVCRVHADNLTHPVELRVRIEQIVEERRPVAELRSMLKAVGATLS